MVRRHWQTIVIAMVVAAATAGGPALARSVVDFARNAGRVDGFSAVGPHADNLAGALVATNKKGKLPSGIVPKVSEAENSDRLGGLPETAFVHDCGTGLYGAAQVPIDVPNTYSDVPGFASYAGGAYDPTTAGCHYGSVVAKHAATGVYRVNLYGLSLGCNGSTNGTTISAVVTVHDPGNLHLVANDATVCDPQDDFIVEEVHIFDLSGAPHDASFTVAALNDPFLIP